MESACWEGRSNSVLGAGLACQHSGQSLIWDPGAGLCQRPEAAQEWEPASNRPRSKERSVSETGVGTERDLEAKEGTLCQHMGARLMPGISREGASYSP